MSSGDGRTIIDRVFDEHPPMWHVEGATVPDRWQVIDSEGQVVAETTGDDPDTMNEKACAVMLANAPGMFGILCMLHCEGLFGKRSKKGEEFMNKFMALKLSMERMYNTDVYE